MHIVGTAGHVDHGKSSLVAALTGTNPDRWVEEQLRGMTLDLGFAHLQLEDGTEAGIVDVPGHERFLHNMLAGAAGMELLLLVVAANEGVMPQTVEHLQILRYLNVRRTIVAVSKADLLDETQLARAVADIHESLAGTIAADAPLVPVSSQTGQGLDALREQIAEALRALASRDPDAPVYMPIDRVFALSGLGTIVTGTLMQGRIAVGDTVALEPSGQRARVRSLHVFGSPRSESFGGTRVALNLPAIDKDLIARGEVAASPEFLARAQFTVRFEPLEEALALLRRRMPVRAYIGSAEILGTLVFSSVPVTTDAVRAELYLRTPAVAFPGVRFVVRRLSPKTLLGGGEIEALDATVAAGDDVTPNEHAVLAVLRERQGEAVDLAAIAFRSNLREDAAQAALDALAERGDALRVARPPAYIDAEFSRQLLSRALETLAETHRAEPWTMGATSIALSRTLSVDEPLLIRILAAFGEDGRIAIRGGYYAVLDHQPKLSPEQLAFFDKAVSIDPDHPYLPVAFEEVADAVKHVKINGITKSFDTLLARGALVKVGDGLYRGTQIAKIHAKIAEYIETHGRMTMAEFRDLLGTSRKYAVPLLEWFDSRAITVRSGDYRMLRRRKENGEVSG